MTTPELIGLGGIVLAVASLIVLAYRGFSLLLAAPALAMLATLLAGDPLLPHLTATFMPGVGRFVVQFFLVFLLGAVFGKLMDDSGSAKAIARTITGRLGASRAVMAVVFACAILTYGGVSLFVVAFAVYPVADALFREARIPHRLMPAAITLGAFTFTMTALPGTPAIQNAIPMPLFGTTLFAAPGIGIAAGMVMLGFGLWWLGRAEARARAAGEGYGPDDHKVADPELVRERAVVAENFDPAELPHGHHAEDMPSFGMAILPILTVFAVNLGMAFLVLPNLDTTFLGEPRWAGISLAAVSGIWSVITALLVASVVLIVVNPRRLPELRNTLDAGATGAVLPVFNVASLAGFGAVVAALPVFGLVREALRAVPGGPLVSLSVTMSVMGIITGSTSAAQIIALDTLGEPLAAQAIAAGIAPELMHRVAALAAAPLSMLPHSGAIITVLTICGATQRDSFGHVGMVTVVGPMLGLIVAIALGKTFGAF